MDFSNKNQKNDKNKSILEQAAKSWAKICLFHIQQKRVKNQNKNKGNTHAYSKR